MSMGTREAKFTCTWQKQLEETCSGITRKGELLGVLWVFVLTCMTQSGLHSLLFSPFESLTLSVLAFKKRYDVLSVWYNALSTSSVRQYFFHRVYKSQHDLLFSCDRTLSNTDRNQCRCFSTEEWTQRCQDNASGNLLLFMIYSVFLSCLIKIVLKIHILFI